MTKQEQYELTIKNMQSKIDYLREQRENLTTYAKKYKPLTFSELCEIEHTSTYKDGEVSLMKFARAIEAAHGIKE